MCKPQGKHKTLYESKVNIFKHMFTFKLTHVKMKWKRVDKSIVNACLEEKKSL